MADPLEELKKRLYKKGESFERRMRRPSLTPALEKAPPFWKEKTPVPRRNKILTPKFWLIAGGLLILVLALLYFFGLGSPAREKIDLKIISPEAVEGGERVSWEVLAINNNPQALWDVEIIFEYPLGAKPLDQKVRALRERRVIGKIAPGESVKTSFEAFVFGEEGEEKTARATLEYRPSDSNAILAKEKEAKVKISRSPVGLSLEFPKKVRSGQELEVKINYVSNAKAELSDVFLEVEYPFGFTFNQGIPEPEGGTKFWSIGRLAPGDSGAVIVKGLMAGSDNEEKSFRVRLGRRGEGKITEVYGAGVGTVLVKRPFLDVGLKIQGEKEVVARGGDVLEAEITFKNNLPVPVQNASLEVFFTGTGLDERQIRSDFGAYRALSRSVLWNASSAEVLRKLNPGEDGVFRLRFAFLAAPPLRSPADKNFKLTLTAKIAAGETPSGFFGADVTSEDTAEVKLASDLQLVRRGFYFYSSLPNSGPLPPRVDQETTFTVVWSLINSTNDADQVLTKAPLPAYMSWKGIFVPAGENLTFNEASGEILWKVGLLKAGTGFLRPAREVSFQVGFIPGQNQAGDSPELLGQSLAEGRDIFAETLLQAEAPALTLGLEDDARVDFNQTRVVE